VWPHEIPDPGISHRNTESGPRSGTEAGDISPVFAALEHAAGDLTTLGTDPLLGGSGHPSDTFSENLIEQRDEYHKPDQTTPVGAPSPITSGRSDASRHSAAPAAKPRCRRGDRFAPPEGKVAGQIAQFAHVAAE
jgi:hypothetical protein